MERPEHIAEQFTADKPLMVSRRVTRKKAKAPGEWDRVGIQRGRVTFLSSTQGIDGGAKKKVKNVTEHEQKAEGQWTTTLP